MSNRILKSHNKSLLLYHFVCPIKYRRTVLTNEVSSTFKDICLEIEDCYDIQFLEIGLDGNHVHFLLQSVPILSLKKIINLVKRITSKEIFGIHPEVKRKLWGGKLWTSGYYVNTVDQYANEEVIKKYLQNKGKVLTKKSIQINYVCFDTSYALRRGSSLPNLAAIILIYEVILKKI